MKFFDKFWWRTALTAVLAVIIFFIVKPFVPVSEYSMDYTIVYSTLISCVLGFFGEFGVAALEKRRPIISELGGAGLFGSILVGALLFIITHLS